MEKTYLVHDVHESKPPRPNHGFRYGVLKRDHLVQMVLHGSAYLSVPAFWLCHFAAWFAVFIQEGFLTEISLADSVGTLALGWADVSQLPQLHCSTMLLAVVLDFVASLLLQQICVCTRTNGW